MNKDKAMQMLTCKAVYAQAGSKCGKTVGYPW